MSPMDVGVTGADWRKSRRSVANGACVEVASATEAVMVRDSVHPTGPVVRYTAQAWQSFLASAKADAFGPLR